ncbi:MAG TPA: GlxA family transcriptional regulator [Dongiaceae bacterium]|nr:GlxA family transcriptional regulator [Dongiaceae bacterium]
MIRKLSTKAGDTKPGTKRPRRGSPPQLGATNAAADGASAWTLAEPRIGFLLVPQFSMLELFCAIEPLRIANRLGGLNFSWSFLSADGGPVSASNGIPVAASQSLAAVHGLPILFVMASFEPEATIRRRDQAKLRDLARHGTLLGGIDTGPFILARAGLLQDRRTTLHWQSIAAFSEEFPDIATSDHVFELDRDRLTCPGGTAPIDMMLHLVALRAGEPLANAIAEQIVHPRIRPGHDPQRMTPAERYQIDNTYVSRAITAMEDHLDEPLSLAELAEASQVSQRQLERLFREQMKTTAKAFYVRLRLERARQLLAESQRPVGEIALATGFASRAHFSRAYLRAFGTPPGHRRRAQGSIA